MRIVAARQGLAWLGRGWGLFRRSPMAWLALISLYWFLVALLNQVPVIGPVLATIFLPAFSMSFMNVSVEVEAGRQPTLSMLWSGFRQRLTTLVTLGGLYLLAVLTALGASALVDGGTLFHWIVSGDAPPEAAIRDGLLTISLLVAGAAATPVLMAYWFSPVLAAWRGMGALQSLFYSFFASLRNWRAFLLYGAALVLIGMLMSVALLILALLFGGNPAVLHGVMLGLTLIMLPTVFASFYFGYRDVFPEEANVEATTSMPVSDPPAPPEDSA